MVVDDGDLYCHAIEIHHSIHYTRGLIGCNPYDIISEKYFRIIWIGVNFLSLRSEITLTLVNAINVEVQSSTGFPHQPYVISLL